MNSIKTLLIILCFLFISYKDFAIDVKKADSLKYTGAFFEVMYPSNFTVLPSISSNIPDLYDSVFFISPDKKVKFYVFAPQWSGDAIDIAFDASIEVEKDTKVETINGVKHKWYTFERKDKSKLRSYQETTNEEGTTKLIIGIEYVNRESYKKYKEAYINFKKSIRQFAD